MQEAVLNFCGWRVEGKMSRIVYDVNLIKIMSMFERLTAVQLKDCISLPGELVFVVAQDDVGKAVGNKGKNVRRLGSALKSRIRIVEFSDDPVKFIKNLIYPLQATSVESGEGLVVLTVGDSRTRSMIIGRNASRLRSFEAIVQRYFPVKEIRVT